MKIICKFYRDIQVLISRGNFRPLYTVEAHLNALAITLIKYINMRKKLNLYYYCHLLHIAWILSG